MNEQKVSKTITLSKPITTKFGDQYSGVNVMATTDDIELSSVSITQSAICATIYPICGGVFGSIDRNTCPKELADAATAFEDALAKHIAQEVNE